MRYVCRVCGYVYDEEKEGVRWSDLPDGWKCPMCGAPRSAFSPESADDDRTEDAGRGKKPRAQAPAGDTKLTAAELSAVFSNLARGCEKQYMPEEKALFASLAERFAEAVPPAEDADISSLAEAVARNADESFAEAKAVAEDAHDRGAMRALVWGEKVTTMLKGLLDRVAAEGTDFLRDTSVWVCSICGFVYVGDEPPALCPVCKVPAWKFEEIGRKG